MIDNAFDMPNLTPPDQLGVGGTAPSLDQVLGFVTEFNENVAIFNLVAGLIIQNTAVSMSLQDRILGNRMAIENTRRNLNALASVVSRASSTDDPRNTEGYSSDEPTMMQPDMV